MSSFIKSDNSAIVSTPVGPAPTAYQKQDVDENCYKWLIQLLRRNAAAVPFQHLIRL